MKLTPEQVTFYEENGYLIAPNVITDEDLQPVADELTAFIDRRAHELKAEGEITELFEDEPFETRIALLAKQSPNISSGMDIMQLFGKAMFAFIHNQNLLDAVECLIGPEISCSPIQHVRAKVPGGPGGYLGDVPWHQDAGVMWEEADASNIVTTWVPMVNATRENGCMEIIPGVHKMGYLEHQLEGGTTIKPEVLPDIEPVCAECPKGGAVFLNKLTPHKGLPNLTEKEARWTIDLRYQVTGTPTGRPFQPDFPVRSADPSKVMDDHAKWIAMWKESIEKRGNHLPSHRPAEIAAKKKAAEEAAKSS